MYIYIYIYISCIGILHSTAPTCLLSSRCCDLRCSFRDEKAVNINPETLTLAAMESL